MIPSHQTEVIIGEFDTLPNITGAVGFPLFNGTISPYGLNFSRYSGAFKGVKFSTADTYLKSSAYAQNSNGTYIPNLDASITPGTGYGIYKNGAYVRPKTVTLCYWKRRQ